MLPAGKSVTHWFAFHMFLSRASSRASRIALPNILFASKVFSQRVASILVCLQVDVTSANQTRPSSRPQMCIMRDRSCSLKPAVRSSYPRSCIGELCSEGAGTRAKRSEPRSTTDQRWPTKFLKKEHFLTICQSENDLHAKKPGEVSYL